MANTNDNRILGYFCSCSCRRSSSHNCGILPVIISHFMECTTLYILIGSRLVSEYKTAVH